MKRLGEKTGRERENLSPEAKLISDVTLYMNHDSLFEPVSMPIGEYGFTGKISKRLTNFAEAMIEKHISYDINARKNVEKIDSPAVFLADLRILNEKEVKALTSYVENGGTLIATAMTGTLTKDGEALSDFALSDLLGVHLLGQCDLDPTYIRRADPKVTEFADYDEGYPIAVLSTSALVKADEDVEILGYITNPLSSATNADVFSSAISDPPIVDTNYPAVTRRRVGKGQAIYVSTSIEESLHPDGRGLLTSLILSAKERNITVEAPSWLEVVAYLDEDNNRYLVNFVNTMTKGYEAVVPEVKVSLKTDKMITKAYNITEECPANFKNEDGKVSFSVKNINNYAMVELKF
jgi:beta-galactosidase GanA